MSILCRKSQKCRNNEKSFMITKLLHSLDNHKYVESPMYRPRVEIDVFDTKNDIFSKVAGDDVGCLNVECEFLKFQNIFYKNRKFFILPIVSGKLHCIVCDKVMRGELRRSEITMLANNSIRI